MVHIKVIRPVHFKLSQTVHFKVIRVVHLFRCYHPKRGLKLTIKEDACEEAKKLYGYFPLLSNDIKDPVEALRIYRAKDIVEKAFGNIKERLNGRRMLVSSDAALDGKLDKKLFGKCTLQGLLDGLDIIECFKQPGKDPYIGEILTKQRDIYCAMDVQAPESTA